MTNKINDAYVHALLNGLAQLDKSGLDEDGGLLIKQACELLGRQIEPAPKQALLAITGQVWEEGKQRYFNPGRLELTGKSILPSSTEKPVLPDTIDSQISEELTRILQIYPDNSALLRYSLYHLAFAWGSRLAFGESDRSIFDSNRLLAATVQCLKCGAGKKEPGFLLLKGAVSGIQSFIYYDIGGEQIDDAKRASKRLRGRSFLVAHLCQVISEYIIEVLGLEQANILFVGGGHFNLLLPDTTEVSKKLEEIQKDLNWGLLGNFGMQISLLLAWEKAGPDLFQNANKYYRVVSDKLEHSKQKRYVEHLEDFFEYAGGQGHAEEVERIGTLIPYAEYLLEVKAEESGLIALEEILCSEDKKAIKTFRFIGRLYYVFKDKDWHQIKIFINTYEPAIEKNNGRIKVINLNETSLVQDEKFAIPVGLGFQFVGNEAPKREIKLGEEVIFMFEDIAKMDEKGSDKLSYPQLAAMRLDVDDLGILFGYGFGKDTSFERVASLSREFQLFFGGYFNTLARKHNLYITYSGGDDAFVIGSWLNVVHFAESLIKAFREFTCGNKHIGFSAGIFMCSPFYPVVRFAEDAAILEAKAKAFGVTTESVGKNALSIFNQVLDWTRFEEMMVFAKKLEKVVPKESENKDADRKGGMIRRSMLQRFLGTIQASRKSDFEFYHNIGRLYGLVSRHGYRKDHLEMKLKEKDPAAEIIKTMLQGLDSKEQFADFIVPLQYVLYQTRVVNQ